MIPDPEDGRSSGWLYQGFEFAAPPGARVTITCRCLATWRIVIPRLEAAACCLLVLDPPDDVPSSPDGYLWLGRKDYGLVGGQVPANFLDLVAEERFNRMGRRLNLGDL
jgi:hypothetical protein